MGQICSSVKKNRNSPEQPSKIEVGKMTAVNNYPEMGEKKVSNGNESKTNPETSIKTNQTQNTGEYDIIINNEILIHKVIGTPLEKYSIIKDLGEGSFGKVYLVMHKDSKVQRAMKEIKKDENTLEKDIQNEITILKKLDHPNIVKIYEFFSHKDKYYLITEYCNEGELYDHINKIRIFEEDHAASVIFQILLAVNYCHSKKYYSQRLKT